MQLEARAQVEIAAPPEAVFDVGADHRNFARFIHAFGPIPGIASSRMHADAVPAAGAHRDVHMSDGSTIEEVILAFDRPSRHGYRWLRAPAGPFSLIVRAGEGEFRFEPTHGGRATRVCWTYTFELTSPLVYPIALVARVLFERWMDRALVALRALIEHGA